VQAGILIEYCVFVVRQTVGGSNGTLISKQCYSV